MTKSIKQPSGTDWGYISPLLTYDEIKGLLGRPFDPNRDQFFATNLGWRDCQVLAVPFVNVVKQENGGALNVAVTTPTGQGGQGQTKSLTIGWTIIKGE